MSDSLHSRARQLLAQERVEGLGSADRQWLAAHLEECRNCAASASELSDALRSLRTAPISLPSGLAARTQFRVQLRAQELRERAPHRRVLWTTCMVSWVLGVVSAPYVWHIFEWIGQHTGAPRLLLQIGFGLWWGVPALFAAAAVLIENARHRGASQWRAQG
jgi:hypothetical protein